MGFDKYMGKDRRRPYHRSGQYDRTCRPGGFCPYCKSNRTHSTRKREASAESTKEER